MTPGLILLPFGAALLAFVCRARVATAVGLLGAGATALLVLTLTAQVLAHGPQRAALGGWPAPLGIQLQVDGLALLFLLMTAAVGSLLSLFAAGYFALEQERNDATPLFWPLWLLLWGTLNGLYVAADVFTLYVLLEVGLLAAVALATLSPSHGATVAALRYLLAALTASVLYLMGVAILYDLHGVLDLSLLAAALEPGWPTTAALLLMTAGLLTKAALFPLHFWLPPAHASAPAPVSAILSALVIKSGFYVLLRLWLAIGPQPLLAEAGLAIGALAVTAIFWGSLQALRQRRLKLLIAYSTVAQVGFFFLALPLATSFTGWAGGALQVTAHALAKAALFLAAGLVILARAGDQLSALRGLAWQRPLLVLGLLLGGLGLYGVPASGAYAAKELLTEAARASGQGWWAPALEVGGWLTAAYVLVMLRYTVYPTRGAPAAAPVPLSLQAIPLLLAGASLGLGWLEPALLELLQLQLAPGGDP